MPRAAADARTRLDGLVDDLPLVARGFPDRSSQLAVSDYDRATLVAPQTLLDMFSHSWEGLRAHAAGDSLARLGNYLIAGNELTPAEATTLFSVAVPALAGDPANAGRLNNAAIALFLLGAADPDKLQQLRTPAGPVNSAFDLPTNASRLLGAATKVFPTDRNLHLNLAFLTGLGYSAGGRLLTNQADALGFTLSVVGMLFALGIL